MYQNLYNRKNVSFKLQVRLHLFRGDNGDSPFSKIREFMAGGFIAMVKFTYLDFVYTEYRFIRNHGKFPLVRLCQLVS